MTQFSLGATSTLQVVSSELKRRVNRVRTIGALAAKSHFSELLDAVERGEDVLITRRGKPIARMAPAGASDRSTSIAAFARLRAAANSGAKIDPPVTAAEILSWRDDGRR